VALTIRPLDPERDLAEFLRVRDQGEVLPLTPDGWQDSEQRARRGAFRRHLVGEMGGEIVAVASVLDHHLVDDGVALRMVVDRRRRRQGNGRAMLAAVEDLLAERRPAIVDAVVRDDDPESRAWIERRGFAVQDHGYPSRLDLERFDPSPHRPAVERAEAAGIRFERATDMDRLYELYVRLMRDIPDSLGAGSREQFVRDMSRPGTLLLVASDAGGWVGMALVMRRPPDGALNAFTGVLPEYRGRGLARALKVLAAEETWAGGRRWIITYNNALNAPMLAVNRALGYERLVGQFSLRKRLNPHSA
jgi:mycothiol synthase